LSGGNILFGGYQCVCIFKQPVGSISRKITRNELQNQSADAILYTEEQILIAGSNGVTLTTKQVAR
jgi:hypothetical protein